MKWGHWELHALLFMNSVWVLLRPTGLWTFMGCEHSRVVRWGLRFIVLTREDLEVLTICRCNYKGSTCSSVILRPWVLVWPELNSLPPTWQPDAQSTEPPVRHPILILNLIVIFLIIVLEKNGNGKEYQGSFWCDQHSKLPYICWQHWRWMILRPDTGPKNV